MSRARLAHAAPILLAAIGVLLGSLSAVTVDRRAEERLATDLEIEATDFARLLESFAGRLATDVSALSAIGAVADDPAAAHRTFIASNDVSEEHALVDLSGPDPQILSVWSAAGDDLEEYRQTVEETLARPSVEADIRRLAATPGFAMQPLTDTSMVLLMAAAHDGARVVADLVLFDFGPTASVVEGQIGDLDALAIYVSADPDPSTVVITNTAQLPLTGPVHRETIRIGSQPVLIEVSGSPDPVVPPVIVLGGWLAVTWTIAWFLRAALRQRDAAVAAKAYAEQAEERFRAAIAGSPDAILLWETATDRIRVLNRDTIFGHPVDELSDPLALIGLAHPDDQHKLLALRENHSTETDDGELRVRCADGSEAWAHIRLAELPDSGDVLAIVTDVSAVRRAREDRAMMEAEMQQAQRLESIGQLAGGVAHDFNNLLAAIGSTAELIAADVTDPRTQRDVAEILDATRRGATLTRRLLTFSRRGFRAHETLDLNDVLREITPLLRRTIGANIQLDIVPDPSPVPVVGDPAELEQVLLNLVVNARDAATGPGLSIQIATERIGDRALLLVSDNGSGMLPEVRDRVFEPFFTTKEASGGSGLGLSIVHGIVQRMDGTVTIDSEPELGTRFRIELPLAAPQVEAPAAVPTPGTVAPEPVAAVDLAPVDLAPVEGLVLLVEDEPAVRRAAQRLVERAGYHVQVAADGIEAIEKVSRGLRPTVLLTDVILPGNLTGRDVAHRVRSMVPGVRVIYASGYDRDVISADELEAEGDQFLAKPFHSDALLTAIRAATATQAEVRP